MTQFANLVHELSASTGTGDFTLTAQNGKQRFSTAFGTGGNSRFTYFISNQDATEWEAGSGHMSDATTLVRDAVIDSSNSGSAVDFSVGTKNITNAAPASTVSSAYFNVCSKPFGALGDGTTSNVDAQAVQAAIDAAAASALIKTVYIPNSVAGYVFDTTVTIPAGVTVRGDNKWNLGLSRIKPKAGFSAPLFQSDGYGVTRILHMGMVGLTLDGSSTTLEALQVSCQESWFQDLCIRDCFTYGVHVLGVGSASDQQALNNMFLGCYIAGQVGVVEFFDNLFLDNHTADTKVVGCYFEAAKDALIRSRGYNDQIIGCHLFASSASGGGGGYGYYSEFAADKTFTGNYVENTANAGVFVDSGASDVATLNLAASANNFRNINKGASANGVIVVQGTNVSSLSISGNVVRRDNATSFSTPYFVYFNSITPPGAAVYGNVGASGLITTAETNTFNFNNLTLNGFLDITEIAEPSSPAANVARTFAYDGNGTTRLAFKDSAGAISTIGFGKATIADINSDALLTASSSEGGYFADFDCFAAQRITLINTEDQSAISGGGYRDALFIDHLDRDQIDYTLIGQKVSYGIRSYVTGYNDGSGYLSQYKDFIGGDFAAIGNCAWSLRGCSGVTATAIQHGAGVCTNEFRALQDSDTATQSAGIQGGLFIVQGRVAAADVSHVVRGVYADNIGKLATHAFGAGSHGANGDNGQWNYLLDGTDATVAIAAIVMPASGSSNVGTIIVYDSNDYSFYDRIGNAFAWVIGGTVVTTLSGASICTNAGISVVAGTTAPIDLGGGNVPLVQGVGTGATSSVMAARYSNDANPARLRIVKSRGSIGAHGGVQNGDGIGELAFQASDGTNYLDGAHIRAVVSAAPGTNDLPIDLLFEISPDGGSAPITAARIKANRLLSTAEGSFGRGAPVTKTADFTVADTENWLIVNKASSCTVTLPSASAFTGREIMIKTITANAVVSNASNVTQRASTTTNTSILTGTAGNWATLVSDGTNWILMAGTP